MGFQEVKKLHQHRHGIMQVEEQDVKKAVLVLAGGGIMAALPLPLKVKVGRRRHREGDEEEEEAEAEAVTTPRGEGCRIPAEAATCPPAPKKPRTAAVSINSSRRCNCDGDVLEFFRVPADLEAVFVSRAAAIAKAN